MFLKLVYLVMEQVFQELKVHCVTFHQIHGIEKSICFLSDNSLLKNGKKNSEFTWRGDMSSLSPYTC